MAAEQCLADKVELVAFPGDLKWCFVIPAQVVIELVLLRLGVSAFYNGMLDDTEVHNAKRLSRRPASQRISCVMTRSASTSPVILPVDTTKSVSMYRTWFVGDSGLYN
jgi:hypothetical protein